MIKILDKNVANKIAAGEVVDRPVSIVKELVENALDSGASQITVEIRDGGKNYIRVTDNGCGIKAEETEMAFRRHATSKITCVKDLDTINTLGFRGEALASICAVSRVELISKVREEKLGRKVIIENSNTIENIPIGCPDGTTVTVRDLFFNVPARYKFLASDASETRKIIDFVSKIALSYSDIRFNVINGSKRVFTTSGKGNIYSNILNIYGTDIGNDLISVEKSIKEEFTLKGFVSSPKFSLSTRNRQIFCVNGRIISSNVIEGALDKAYKERLFSGRFPAAFLFLAVPPQKIDVNIHPRKNEVRFDDNVEIEDFICSAVTEALKSEKSVPEIQQQDISVRLPEFTVKDDTRNYKKEATKIVNKENESSNKQVDINSLLTTLRMECNEMARQENDLISRQKFAEIPFDFNNLRLVGSIFKTYIVASDEETLYLIDQHAAHERIFYEKLVKQYNSSEKMMQQLMIPLNFNVSTDVVQTEAEWLETVRKIGYDVEFFGSNTYIVREIPAFMELKEAEEFLNDLFNEFTSRPNYSNERIMDKIIMKSCKSAVKAGDLLDNAEVAALIDQLKLCNNPFSCPHGRPTFIRMKKHEIERMFKRI